MRTLKIIVLPPWWKTTWAYLCYAILLILSGYGIYQLIRARQAYSRQILTERLKAEQAIELDQHKSRFFTNVSHEFRTPLTLIIDPLDSLVSGKIPSEKLPHYYSIMYRNARRLLGLINQFLDFRKLESGSQQLHVANHDIVAFVRNVIGAFELEAQRRQIKFRLITNHDSMVFGFDADIVDKIQ